MTAVAPSASQLADAAVRFDDAPAATTDLMYAFSILRLQNARLLEGIGAECGITANDFRALHHIAGVDSATPKRVADYLGLTTGAMTPLIDRIEKAGLVRREQHPTDRRSLLLRITDEGMAVVRHGRAIYIDAFDSALGGEDREMANRIFTALSDRLGLSADRLGTSQQG